MRRPYLPALLGNGTKNPMRAVVGTMLHESQVGPPNMAFLLVWGTRSVQFAEHLECIRLPFHPTPEMTEKCPSNRDGSVKTWDYLTGDLLSSWTPPPDIVTSSGDSAGNTQTSSEQHE